MATVSIIIPAYNQAPYVATAIQSVQSQTYADWELIVVDDGSTDETAEVVRPYADGTRIRYVHQANKGLPGARNTGIRHATADYLAFLDADDWYHPEKLAEQVRHLREYPDVGLSYTSRIDVAQDGSVLNLRRAPAAVTLRELVLGYPFVINDILVRRRWVTEVGGFDESFRLNSEDRDFYLRLALAGCRFGRVDRFLAYRRFHARRTFRDIPAKMDTYFRALDTAFKDARCPAAVLALRNHVHADHYLIWGFQAAVQGEAALAEAYFRQVQTLEPELVQPGTEALPEFVAHYSTHDGGEHEAPLAAFFACLPPEWAWLETRREAIAARGYVLRAVAQLVGEKEAAAVDLLNVAVTRGARMDAALLGLINDQIVNFGIEFGFDRARRLLDVMLPYVRRMGSGAAARQLAGRQAANEALAQYRAQAYGRVPRQVLRAVVNQPGYLLNRGMLSIFVRSLLAGVG